MNDPIIMFEDKKLNPFLKGNLIQTNVKLANEEIINKYLINKVVRVYWSSAGHKLNYDNAYITSMCIKGTLEHKGNLFRVLIEDEIYCYFNYEDILTIGIRTKKTNSIALKSNKNH
jgi:hypothetical protein